MEKHYRSGVYADGDYDDLPEVVAFSIEEATAREIIRLAAMAKANDLYKVEKFDYRASYYRRDPDKALQAPDAEGEDNNVRTDADCLNVSPTEFWFSAYLKHCDFEIRGDSTCISELVDFFGIVTETEDATDGHQPGPQAVAPSIAAERAEVDAFLHQVAGLSIWRYDNKDGEPYRECQLPSDGFLDSHYCLMELIEQARHLQGGSIA